MNNQRVTAGAVLPLVVFASLAGLAYEITLMRVFSISLWYHFAFMVISIAMLGIGASGTMLSVFPALKDISRIQWYALALAATIPASYLLANAVPFDPARISWDRTQLLLISIYYLVLAVPFFCFGLIVSTAYAELTREANAVYASDLVGAGVGSLAVFWLLFLGGPEKAVFIISSLLATGILSFGAGKIRCLAALLVVANLSVLYAHPPFIAPRISPYKPFELAMKFPGAERIMTHYSPYARVDLFRSPAARFAPGLSFRYLDPLPDQTGIAVDGGEIHAITDGRDKKRLRFLRFLPSSLVHRLAEKSDTLVVEPRGGLGMLLAKELGARNVVAVDSNPLVVDVVRDYSRLHGSGLYSGNTWTGLGRTWLRTAGRDFDVIDLSLMGSLPASAFGFSEDYRFTAEAFREYLAHLRPDGFLSLSLYILPPPRAELRLIATIAKAAEHMGIGDISRHIAVIRSWDTLTVLVKRSTLTAENKELLRDFTREMRFDLVYYPGIRPEESNVHIKMRGNEYFEAFQRLMNAANRESFIKDYLFDIRPATDEKPFFYYYLRFGNIREIFRVMGQKWQYFFEEGYLLPVLSLQALAVSVVLVLLPLVKFKGRKNETGAISREGEKVAKNAKGDILLPLAYFALLGLAFLFVEVVFIQKMVLALENPAYASSTVIATTLISSGVGSLLSQKIRQLRSFRVLIILAGIVLLYSIMLPGMITFIIRYTLTIRVILAAFAVLPVGLFMGIPFPLGISTLGRTAPSLIPWAWAVNGCFSVLSPVLAIMLALTAGFNVVLMTGAGMYLLAYGVMQSSQSDDIRH